MSELTAPDGSGAPIRPSTWNDTNRAVQELAHPELKRFKPVGTTRTAPDTTYEEAEALRTTFYDAAANILTSSPASKSRAVALTELEGAMMWALRAYYGAPGEEVGL